MRELKGDWKDIFRCFMLALDLRKMFLAFCGVVLTISLVGGVQVFVAKHLQSGAHATEIYRPTSLAPHEILKTWGSACHLIYSGCPNPNHPYNPKWYTPTTLIVSLAVVVFFLYIWSYFGGAIARIAAYEIAKDERIETAQALKFSANKINAFIWAPLICIIGFGFFFLCNAIGGGIGWVLNYLHIGAPIVAIFLPLALLSGFIMMLIVVGSIAGCCLFQPAVGAEGTDAFDAVSRGFSYIYAKPWHFIWYQIVAKVYGYICVMFVLLFTLGMCVLALKSGAKFFGGEVQGYNDVQYHSFKDINKTAWSTILSHDHTIRNYKWRCQNAGEFTNMIMHPHPYGRFMAIASRITGLHTGEPAKFNDLRINHRIAGYIILAYLLITMGMAASYIISYFQSAQTMIYFLMRKKVDGIDMDEVYEEPEEKKEEAQPPTEAKKEETK